MTRISRFAAIPIIAMAFLLMSTGCRKSQDQTAANTDAAQNPSTDPAAANLAPTTSDSTAPAPANTSASSPAPAPAPSAPAPSQSAPVAESGDQYASSSTASEDPGYGVAQPVAYATQPPPELPEYQQPADPGDGYLWTPGYWAWAPTGYYWVPGAWVQAPYEGALWTPGYWGFWGGHYGFYRGYWGRHIGYYGGINYGFGYVGFGYQGGYWNGGHFNYNRNVNNVDIRVVRNVYSYNVVNRTNITRVSFNGGSGGVQVRARPQELVALREQHTAPMSTQIQHEQAARADRAQFAAVNHGRPANLVVSHPIAADRNVRAPEAMPARNQPAVQQHQPIQQQQQQRQITPQQQRQLAPQQQHQMQQQQRQGVPQQQQQRQGVQQQQQRQAVQQQQQQRQAAQQQRQAAPQQRQAAPQQQRQAAPQQRQAAPQQQRQAAPQRKDEHPKN